jgi:1-pyrroline-5-carboxylate dehydrogenase
MSFRLTYATMFNPPEELHERFDRALATQRSRLGATHPMFIDGKDVPAAETEERVSPIDSQIRIGRFPHASSKEVDAAIAAAERAFPAWRDAGAERRVALMRKVADVLEERVYEIAAALVLEVGKNRLEALGEAQECVDFFRVYADDFEAHKG